MSRSDAQRRKILVADSCFGGLSVLQHLLSWSGEHEIIYLADGEKNPFGLRNETELVEIVEDWVERFTTEPFCVDTLVVACNTASIGISDRRESLEDDYDVDIITMADGLRECLQSHQPLVSGREVHMYGTKFTVGNRLYYDIVKKFSPAAVRGVEQTEIESIVANAKYGYPSQKAKSRIVTLLNENAPTSPDTIIALCTCLAFIEDEVREAFGPGTDLIDPSASVSTVVRESLANLGKCKPKPFTDVAVYVTGDQKEWSSNGDAISTRQFSDPVNPTQLQLR